MPRPRTGPTGSTPVGRRSGPTLPARLATLAFASMALALTACAGSSNEASPPIATAGTVVDTAPIDGEVPDVVAVHPVLQTAVGLCEDFGVGMRVDGRRCLTVGAPLELGDWVAGALAEYRGDLGWVVRVDVAPAAFAEARDAFAAAVEAGADRFVVVADGRGLLGFQYLALAGTAAFGPLLSEREATVLAAVLNGDAWPDLDRRGAQVGDVWLAALSVHVCGEWLAPAPPTDDAAGLHSHGDGLVYVHPSGVDDTGDDADLGRFLEVGGWSATADRLVLWDGVDVGTGTTCPDGREATVRWSVDGEERDGDPGEHRIGHRQVIVISFDPPGESPIDTGAEPPQVAALPTPSLGPDLGAASG